MRQGHKLSSVVIKKFLSFVFFPLVFLFSLSLTVIKMSAFPVAHVTLHQASKVNLFPERFSRHLFLKVLIVSLFPAHIKGTYRKSSRLTFRAACKQILNDGSK